ncbi:uncharacterized protein QC761_100570 [Podospora bellae-mahoneyi]|uniref:Heterokaryon incompatibility domain-containing protein n=1 Tax=Podospora bellae-mahoneyi TaxID=2093777 RepID=A0ABR0FUV1_9PEZI|nr:hypothetical protein QC761_100570 [Podospora bellae-mahoneyi]
MRASRASRSEPTTAVAPPSPTQRLVKHASFSFPALQDQNQGHSLSVSAYTMSRWHLETCMSPDMVVTGGTHIYCMICNQAPDIDKLVADPDHQDPTAPSIPPDEPYGAYNLSWPPGIPYRRTGQHITREEPVDRNEAENSNSSEGLVSNIQVRAAYEKALGPDEFRIICLPSTDDVNTPIHLMLETYGDERYPEYETVSYTWGGEDEDGTLCKPVFVGPYWDVLLQTKNCWEMLRFLRPRRGYRLVWVDAICINQLDSLERATQVAKMRSIYKNSRRTVVYLGPEISPITTHAHPVRLSAREAVTLSRGGETELIGSGGKVNLGQLLLCRYFSRIWLFSLLGLVPNNNLTPDYGISRIHAQIGVAAHSLFRLGSFENFYIAPTQQRERPDNYPSWVPYRARTGGAARVSWTSQEPERVLQEFYEALKRHFDKSYSGRHVIYQPEEDNESTLWTAEATIDVDTAALTLKATHLATCTDVPVEVPFTKENHFRSRTEREPEWKAFVVRSNEMEMYLLSNRSSALDKVVKPFDHIYWLHRDYTKEETPGFLILRPIKGQEGKRFRLIGFCSQVLFVEVFVAGRKTVPNRQPNRARSIAIHYLSFSNLQRGLKRAVDDAVAKFGCLEELFPGVVTPQGQLLSFLALMKLASWPSEPFTFFSEYLSHLDSRYDGVVTKEMRRLEDDQHEVEILTITVPSTDISKFVLSWGYLRSPFVKFQQLQSREGQDVPWDESRVVVVETLQEDDVLRLRAELSAKDLADLRRSGKRDSSGPGEQQISNVISPEAQTVWKYFQELEKARWATGGMGIQEMVGLVQSGQDTSSMACPEWPADIVDAFQAQGNTLQITIV